MVNIQDLKNKTEQKGRKSSSAKKGMEHLFNQVINKTNHTNLDDKALNTPTPPNKEPKIITTIQTEEVNKIKKDFNKEISEVESLKAILLNEKKILEKERIRLQNIKTSTLSSLKTEWISAIHEVIDKLSTPERRYLKAVLIETSYGQDKEVFIPRSVFTFKYNVHSGSLKEIRNKFNKLEIVTSRNKLKLNKPAYCYELGHTENLASI